MKQICSFMHNWEVWYDFVDCFGHPDNKQCRRCKTCGLYQERYRRNGDWVMVKEAVK